MQLEVGVGVGGVMAWRLGAILTSKRKISALWTARRKCRKEIIIIKRRGPESPPVRG